MPTERPTMLERFNEHSVIRWMRGRTAPSKNGHAQNGAPRAAQALKTDGEAKNLADIVEQMRPDYQVAFCEKILQANVASVRVTIAAEGDDPTATALATKLQELWDSALSGMDDDVAYGRVAHEKVWDADEVGGYHYIRKLEPLPFRETRMKLEEDGRFGGIELKTKHNDWILIPPADAWWQSLDATAKQPHGQSRFLPAPHEVWKEKKGAKKNRSTAQSKWAVRGPVFRGPIVDFDEQTGQQYDVLQQMEPALESHSKGAALYMPNDAHPTMGDKGVFKFMVDQPDLRSFDPNALNSSMERLDIEMCRAFGIPEQTIIEAGAVGTYGSIAQKMLILFAVVEDILSQRVKSFQQYVIEPTKEVNGIPKTVKITATFVPLTKRPDAFVFELVKLLVANPQFIEAILAGAIDVREILKQAGLPVTEQLEQVLLAAAQRMAAATGGVPGQQPGQPGALGGEYASTGRRQWQNNVKAIRDVLGDLIAGKTSETMALELLQSLGLTPERAQVLIGDAKDNARIDDPELQEQPQSLADVLELCGGKGGKPGPCPEGKHDIGGVGKKKASPVVKVGRPTPRPREKQLSVRAARAKAAYNPATKEKQDASEKLEHQVTSAIGGVKSGDNLPMDVVSPNGKVGIEVKMIHDAKDHKIHMRPDSRKRKEAWVKEKPGRKAFIVAVDNRDKFQGGKHKDKYSGHKYYVYEGVGAVRFNSMTKARNLAEVKRIVGL